MRRTPKQAVLILRCDRWTDSQEGPSELLHLVDRPFVHHVVDAIVTAGCNQIDVVLHRWPERFRAVLGDGSRWGVTLRYHVVRDVARPFSRIRAVDPAPSEDRDQTVLVAFGHVLPRLESVLDDVRQDSGWACLPRDELMTVPDALPLTGWSNWLLEVGYPPHSGESIGSLSVESPSKLIAATREVLDGNWAHPLSAGRATSPGVRTAWNATVHPGAKIVAPVFLGEQCWIGDRAVVGPHAVIGRGSIVDAGATVHDAIVEPDSYVGQELKVEAAIADRSWLMDARRGAAIWIGDPLMLTEVSTGSVTDRIRSGLQRFFAAMAFLLVMPIILATAVAIRLSRERPVVYRPAVERPIPRRGPDASGRRREVRLLTFDPEFGSGEVSPRRSEGAADLFLRVLPGLASVAMGHLALVGVEPRPRESVERLPGLWREVYREGLPGLITEADTKPELRRDLDALFASEAYLVSRARASDRLEIVLRYLVRGVSGERRPQPS